MSIASGIIDRIGPAALLPRAAEDAGKTKKKAE